MSDATTAIANENAGQATTAPTIATDTGAVSGDRLKSFIERIERLEEEKKVIADDIKEVYAEAKAVGFDARIIRKVVSIRKMEDHKRREEEEMLDIYLDAIGMR